MSAPITPEERARVLDEGERWFIRHGLPYFVVAEREAARAGLRPTRLALVVGLAVLVGAALGMVVGWAARPSLGLSTGMTAAGLVTALYALTTLRAGPIARWGVRRTFGSLGLLVPLVTRGLPLLLIFITFLFINAEVWELSAGLDGGVLWVVVLFFGAFGVGFLLAELPDELAGVDHPDSADRLLARLRKTPFAAGMVEPEALVAEGRSRLHGFQRANLVLVLLVAQAVQVLLLALTVFLFFIVFGMVAMQPDLVSSWTGVEDPTALLGIGSLTPELVQVSVFLAAFSGLYFTVTAVTDELYRKEFFTAVTDELERAVAARAAYQALRAE
ncbi:MAG: hypothetical protein Q8Q02_08910 [Nocardioides sp.]|nr:hypothetical protein [Nocardioides sp.]